MVSDVVVPPMDELLTMSPLVSDSPPLFLPGARTNFGCALFAPASSSTPATSSVQASARKSSPVRFFGPKK